MYSRKLRPKLRIYSKRLYLYICMQIESPIHSKITTLYTNGIVLPYTSRLFDRQNIITYVYYIKYCFYYNISHPVMCTTAMVVLSVYYYCYYYRAGTPDTCGLAKKKKRKKRVIATDHRQVERRGRETEWVNSFLFSVLPVYNIQVPERLYVRLRRRTCASFFFLLFFLPVGKTIQTRITLI